MNVLLGWTTFKPWAETADTRDLLRETVAPGFESGDPIWGTVNNDNPNLQPDA